MILFGMFLLYMVVYCSLVVKIDLLVFFEVVCLVGCGVIIGYGLVVCMVDVWLGDDVVIVGLGGVGMVVL